MTGLTRPRALELLRREPLRHVVTLKMLHWAGDSIETRLLEDSGGWALLSLFSTQRFEYDRQTYADRDHVVLIDGTSIAAKIALLGGLPAGRRVVKTSDPAVRAHLEQEHGARWARSFLSFTAPPAGSLPPSPPTVTASTSLRPAAAEMFKANGYQDSELARHFADGAVQFTLHRGKGEPIPSLAAACFVFRNFESVWEIGGVYTSPPLRRRGLARQVVAAALCHLVAAGLIPRYQVRADNEPSILLARASGLEEFLRMDHLTM